ncbi:ArsR/SmtB family transcription factor [Seleniivibrio woodruffii]|uniref:ArsR family transcriptional regulator n=1 Tax=Seleniivibrio woodruffii TaxID=1078050 RepID=A0A4V2PRW0_9BACT|nr:metalloregulator ArsR/SmtB family transcription factor [Seleniivibrio woodruffii]TCK60381.1 ArsR family transcriptional regulator [Seleniivibrio woodruffii]TVZ36008.1 ArsR family transcriptional regulator [Seleniivibrio woodruffii]
MNSKVEVFKALGDGNRLRIVCMLGVRDLCVCEINAVLNISMSTISSHLKVLRNAGLVTSKKDGRWIIYSLNKKNTFIADIVNVTVSGMKSDETVAEDAQKLKYINPKNCAEH